MKKKVFAIFILTMILVVALVGCTDNYTKIQLNTGDDGNLSTLMLSDIRFDGTVADSVRKNMIKAMINNRNPEFIIINGNIVNCSNNGKVMKEAVEFIDSFGIPWAASIGELDVKGNTSKKEIVKIMTNKDLKNSLVMHGDSYKYNYVLEMVSPSNSNLKVINLLYFIDTSEKCSDQLVDWYKNTVDNLSFKYADRYGEMLNSHIFINKPLPGFDTNPNNNGSDKFTVTPWENSENFEKAIDAKKSTRAVFAGYDNFANGSEFTKREYLQYAYIRTMVFDSAMTGDTYQKQRPFVGCSLYKFRDTQYVDIDAFQYNPESYKN